MKARNGRAGRLEPTDTRLAKALAHPVRVHAMRILTDRVASPSDIARELELPVANVSYHVNTLLRLKCVEEVETRQVRGAVEHMYRAIRRPLVWSDQWEQLPQDVRDEHTRGWLTAAMDDISEAVHDGSIDALDNRHATRVALRLDAQAFAEIAKRLDEVLDWAMELQAEAAVRLANGEEGGPEVDARMILAHFGRTIEG